MSGLQQEGSLEVGFLPHNPRLPGVLRNLQRITYVRTIVTTLYFFILLPLRVRKYDVIHIFSASYYSYLLAPALAIIVSRVFDRKCILNYRSGEAEDHLAKWRLTAKPIMRLADVIVTPSGYLVEVFARFGLPARAIYNIVELDRFRYRERSPLRPVFLVSRLLEPLYNVACVLRAFAIIQKRYPEASLTVAADGWLRPQLETLANDLNLHQVEFIGFVPFERMAEIYDAADIYLTATDLDNMPSSLTESMASGLPIVTSNAGGIPYIVTDQETCLMFPCNDHEAMAACALRLLDDNQLASRIARQARDSSRKFTWEAVRNDWLKLYRELAPEKAALESEGKVNSAASVAGC
ncbi:MAG: glycosyltransferase family 4 protein [Pyrinomonadaceae bacterium]|nr:glycosyltransferase family 4 protein [Pyrinomonadaceae bacterium]